MKRKILSSLLAVFMMVVMVCPQTINAATTESGDGDNVSVHLMIEGISEQLYSDTVSVAQDATVQDVLETADEASDDIELTFTESSYGDFLSAVNEEAAGQFGGYDGWMFLVNGESPASGMSAITVSDSDEIVVYYADPYGDEGFQYPQLDNAQVSEGTLTFTSDDASYDADGNAAYTTNPVSDATVTLLDTDGKEAGTYTTDENGSITLDIDSMTSGEYTVQISKESSEGKPLVLRSSFTTSITGNATDTETTASVTTTSDDSNSNTWVYVVIVVLVAAAVVAFVITRKKKQA